MTDLPAPISANQTLHQSADELAAAAQLSARRLQRQPPARVPGYDIRRCLGEGAYGSVWLALERNTGKLVAIKFYSHRRGLDWSLLSREVEKLAVLYTCRDIVGLQGVGWDSDPPYYIMEYLDNGSLATRLERGPLSADEAVRIVTSVAQALVHAHGCGILHCDIKPANVLLDKDHAPRLADFGQSRLSHEQETALGTLFYMAPEQADLHAVPDARWDVYALGSLLYQTLVGEPPYRATDLEKRIDAAGSLENRLAEYQRILKQSPRPTKHRRTDGVDKRLADIVDRCLEIDPTKRFANAQAILDALHDRVRARARRPMISLGIAGPAVLLLALVPIALRATNNAVTTAERMTSHRALEANLVTAKVLAKSLATDIDDRRQFLLTLATDELSSDDKTADGKRLRELIVAAADKPREAPERKSLEGVLTEYKKFIDDRRGKQGGTLDSSWFLTDGRGVQLWRDPPDENTIGRNYAWRDYFHGRNVDYPRDQVPIDIEPIHASHVSLPFRSTAEGQRLKVAITAPVFNEAGEVIGVLGRSIQLGDLLAEYKRTIQSSPDQIQRPIALVDVRNGKLLDHPWMTPPSSDTPSPLQRLSDEELNRMVVAEQLAQEFRELCRRVRDDLPLVNQHQQIKYRDPVAMIDPAFDDLWLASVWPVQGTDWVTIVQENKSQATAPVQELRSGLVQYGLWALVVCAGLIALMWYFVLRAMANGRGR
ncbi:MAG: protein kinase [Planctomycetales bacterium]|nr:protein kinase [Planctomycetales bacterium]